MTTTKAPVHLMGEPGKLICSRIYADFAADESAQSDIEFKDIWVNCHNCLLIHSMRLARKVEDLEDTVEKMKQQVNYYERQNK